MIQGSVRYKITHKRGLPYPEFYVCVTDPRDNGKRQYVKHFAIGKKRSAKEAKKQALAHLLEIQNEFRALGFNVGYGTLMNAPMKRRKKENLDG
jgi:hypothetical protein